VRLSFTGNRAQLAQNLCEQMQHAEDLTINNDKLILNVVINYGGKWDILQAVQAIASLVAERSLLPQQIDEQILAQHLNTCHLPDPDLFIRTGGEQRLSNFFLWQLAYTELYFTETYWPDFTVEELEKALASYSLRERRFGKTSQQLLEKSNV
jgi:undecaprenyl diphosphate synthase